ncbi:MAG: hypothetical protein WCA08_24730, partial [Desulfoferrobacter sp.]
SKTCHHSLSWGTLLLTRGSLLSIHCFSTGAVGLEKLGPTLMQALKQQNIKADNHKNLGMPLILRFMCKPTRNPEELPGIFIVFHTFIIVVFSYPAVQRNCIIPPPKQLIEMNCKQDKHDLLVCPLLRNKRSNSRLLSAFSHRE